VRIYIGLQGKWGITGEVGVKVGEFLDIVDDCFLIQWVERNTREGGGNMLGVVFATEPGLIEDMEITAPSG